METRLSICLRSPRILPSLSICAPRRHLLRALCDGMKTSFVLLLFWQAREDRDGLTDEATSCGPMEEPINLQWRVTNILWILMGIQNMAMVGRTNKDLGSEKDLSGLIPKSLHNARYLTYPYVDYCLLNFEFPLPTPHHSFLPELVSFSALQVIYKVLLYMVLSTMINPMIML